MTQALFIEWGMPIEGRELKALEVYATTMQWWEKQKSNGKVADFRAYGTLTGNFAKRSGFLVVDGTNKQIDDLRYSEEFRTVLNQVSTIAHNIHVEILESGDEMMTRMQRYGRTVKDVLR